MESVRSAGGGRVRDGAGAVDVGAPGAGGGLGPAADGRHVAVQAAGRAGRAARPAPGLPPPRAQRRRRAGLQGCAPSLARSFIRSFIHSLPKYIIISKFIVIHIH